MPDAAYSFGGHARPFTATSVQAILGDVLKRGVRPAWAEIEKLTAALNHLHGIFHFAATIANKRYPEPKAAAVRDALSVLIEFFEERARVCADVQHSSGVIDRERALRDAFNAFLAAMDKHDFALDMDAAALMPKLDSWRSIAVAVAGAFKVAMSASNKPPSLGVSNEGPVARFVAAVIPKFTGEHPTVLNVGKFLKDEARKERRRNMGTN